jgi:acyl carrier protein
MAAQRQFEIADLESGLIELIAQNLLETGPTFNADSNLYEAGLDSMAIMQLLLLIEQKFGIMLPESDLSRDNFNDIRSLARLLQTRLAA